MKKVSPKERKENIFRFFCIVTNHDPKECARHEITDEMADQFDRIVFDELRGTQAAVVKDFYGLGMTKSESFYECGKLLRLSIREIYSTLSFAHRAMELYGLADTLLDWYDGYFTDTLEALEEKFAALNEELSPLDEECASLWEKGGLDFYILHKDDGLAHRMTLREHLLYEILLKRSEICISPHGFN